MTPSWRPWPALSIRWQMTLLYTALLAALLAGFGVFVFLAVDRLMIGSLGQTLDARVTQALAAAPEIVAEVAGGEPGAGGLARGDDPGVAPRRFPTLDSLAGPGLFLQVSDRDGRVLAASSNLGRHLLPPPRVPPSAAGAAHTEQIRLPIAGLLPEATATDITAARFLVASSRLVDSAGRDVGLLQVAQSLLPVEEVEDGLVDTLAEGMAVAFTVAVAAGLWLAGRLLRPVADVTATAAQIGSSGDLSRRIPTQWRPRRDEVGQLIVTFDAMLARLEASFHRERQFVADASHEFKTPLTAILGHANLLRRRGRAHPEMVGEAAAAIIEEGERLRHLTADLLDLAKSESGHAVPSEPVSMHGLSEEVAGELRPIAVDRGIQVSVRCSDPPPVVVGDREALKRLIANLVDNALKFTPTGGQVGVDVSEEPAGRDRRAGPADAVLTVRDTGCGIPAEHVPHVFERFYRVDRARSRQAGGNGLGLAIVRDVARRHGGTVDVESQVGQGSVFRVRLPASRGPGAGYADSGGAAPASAGRGAPAPR